MSESVFELGVIIKAVDMLTGPLRSMAGTMEATQGKFDGLNKTMQMMGKSKGEIDAINASLAKMGDRQAFSNIAGDLQKIGMAKEDIAAMESSYMKMAQYQRDMAAAQEKYAAGKDLAMSGVGDVTTGALGAAGIFEMVKQAGEFQSTMTVIKDITGATGDQMTKLSAAVQDASTKVSKYTDYQTGAFAQQLASAGFNVNQVQSLLTPVAKFAEVQSYERKSSSPTESVNQAIQMSHAFGLYDPKQFSSFLNTFNKYSVMQPDDSTQLYQTLQYLNPVGKMLGMSKSDELAMAAIDNRIGLTGSHGGTNSADFIMRLIPGLISGKPTKKGTPAAWAAMEQLGFVDKNGKSPFFTKSGHLTDLNGLLNTMVQDSQKYNPMQLTGLYKSIFGLQGGRAASLLANKTSIEQLGKMQKQLGTVKSVDQENTDLLKTPEGQMNLMKSNSVILMQRVGQQLAYTLNPAIASANKLLNTMLKFSQAHPQVAKLIGDFALLAVGGKILQGVLKIVAGNFKMIGAAFKMFKITSAAGELTRFGKVLSGLGKVVDVAEGFLSRFALSAIQLGARMATGLGKGVMTAIRLFGSFGMTILRLGGQIAAFAVRTAASWILAMGPVGWIIAGVTAIIAAGIIMWKTNFLGFRDGLTAVWNGIKSVATSVWNGIVSYIKWEIDTLKNLPAEMLTLGKNIMQGLINGVKSMIGAVGSTISSIGKGISGAFKSVLGIHSPSRVFMEHGKFIVQGLALGIDGNKQLANRATTNLANALSGAFRPNIQSSSSSNSNSGAINIHSGAIVINGGNASHQELARLVMQEIGKATRRGGLNTGSTVNMGAF